MAKKKSFWTMVTSACLIVPAVFLLTSCSGHTHDYNENWSTSPTEHWHDCKIDGCNEKSDKNNHEYTDDNDFDCNICGYTRTAVENSVTFNIAQRTYNGTSQGLVKGIDFTVGYGTPVVKYKLKNADDSTYTTTEPKNAGNYTAQVFVEGNAVIAELKETKDFVIEQKLLSNIQISKNYDGKITATNTLSANNGVCAGDVVKVTVSTNADYQGQYANAGTKTVTDAQVDNLNYKLPANGEISYIINKAKVNLTTPKNAQEYENGFWQFTRISTPNFNIGYFGDRSKFGTSSTKIEKLGLVDGSPAWVEISAEDAIKVAGNYKLTYTLTEADNYEGGTYVVDFEVKQTSEINAFNSISVTAGQTKTFIVSFDDTQKFYNVGTQMADANIEVYSTNMYGVYNQKNEKLENTDSMNLSGKKLVLITAVTNIDNKVIFENATFDGTYSSALTDTSTNTITVSGTAGKWLTFTIDQDDTTNTQLLISYNIEGATVFFSDDYNRFAVCESGTSVGSMDYQGSSIIIYVYCTQDLNNATITLAPTE